MHPTTVVKYKTPIMKATILKTQTPKSVLKVVRNSFHKEENERTKIYINTLMPNFNYKNSSGGTVSRNGCVFL